MVCEEPTQLLGLGSWLDAVWDLRDSLIERERILIIFHIKFIPSLELLEGVTNIVYYIFHKLKINIQNTEKELILIKEKIFKFVLILRIKKCIAFY